MLEHMQSPNYVWQSFWQAMQWLTSAGGRRLMPKVDAIQTLRYNPHMLVRSTSEPEFVVHVSRALCVKASFVKLPHDRGVSAQVTVLSNRKLSLW